METQDKKDLEPKTERWERNRSGRAMGGLIIVAIGAIFFCKELGMDIPRWIFSWQMFLIAIGFFVGAKHSFRNPGWLIPVGIGTFFLLNAYILDISIGQYIWPLVIILIGLVMIFKPRHRRKDDYWRQWDKNYSTDSSSEDVMDSVAVFGNLKKNIVTKDFKGGEVTLVFSGAELNLSQADIQGKVTLELTQIFAGTKLIVPPHWIIRTEEMVCIFGGIEDKRTVRRDTLEDTDKILVLKGTCIFGGIDIKSY